MHPFEASGLGLGPFRFLYVASLPSPSLAEQNPEAYNAALRSLPRDIPLGVCNHCGMPLMHNFVCTSSDGKKFAVGSECVDKTRDKALGDSVKIAAAKILRDQRRAKADARREINRKAWLIANAPRLEAEAKARTEREAAAAIVRQSTANRWAFVLPVLDGSYGDFCASIAQEIRNGNAPEGRALSIVADIYAKGFGRRNSVAYSAAQDEFYTKIDIDKVG